MHFHKHFATEGFPIMAKKTSGVDVSTKPQKLPKDEKRTEKERHRPVQLIAGQKSKRMRRVA